jgi:sulfite exporter TauE/SafE
MDGALVGSALLMGIAGAPHCAAMCGAAFGAMAGPAAGGGAFANTAALHGGRLLGYAAGGAAVAAGVGAFAALGAAAPWLRPLWTLVHVGAIALGLWLLCYGRAPTWLSRRAALAGAAPAVQPIRLHRRLPAAGRSGLIGACWVGLPCGLLQSALLVAALASGPAQGALVMSAFGVASGIGLWLGPQLWQRLRAGPAGERAAALSVRLAGALLAGASLFALGHGLGAAIEQALCRVVG